MGAAIFGGYRLITVQHWPRECVGEELRYSPSHPHIVWLVERFRWLPRSWASVPYRAKVYRDRDPVIDEGKALIYCSPAQADRLWRQAQGLAG